MTGTGSDGLTLILVFVVSIRMYFNYMQLYVCKDIDTLLAYMIVVELLILSILFGKYYLINF